MMAERFENLDQVRCGFRVLAALNFMDRAEISAAIELADRALTLGMYTDSLCELAIDCPPKWCDSESQFLKVCDDLNIAVQGLDHATQIYVSDLVEPADVSDKSWAETKRRYEQSHVDFRAFIADEQVTIDTFEFMPYHDSYHIGQIMQLRAGFGLEPIE